MTIDSKFYQACNPSKTLVMGNAEDRQYYIDFADVRGGQMIKQMERTIVRLSPNIPTCQLFIGHIGCGKSTELLRLKYQLEQQGFHVVYFESSNDLAMGDVDITNILLAIAYRISKSLKEEGVKFQVEGFKAFIKGIFDFFQTDVKDFELSGKLSVPGVAEMKGNTEGEFSISSALGELTAKSKNSKNLRDHLRQYTEPRTDTLLEQINQELILPAIQTLKTQGKKGLVVIVDNLDRIDNDPKANISESQPEYLFITRGGQLKSLQCHIVYTIPLVLTFSNELGRLINRFDADLKILPMVTVTLRNGENYEQGMTLLRQMILARAFPHIEPEKRSDLISEVFDNLDTLDSLCQLSGGHPRNLLDCCDFL